MIHRLLWSVPTCRQAVPPSSGLATWSLELYQQTNARLWRQGQSETVVIHHIITDGTVDNHVLKALQSKEKTQHSHSAAVKAELYK